MTWQAAEAEELRERAASCRRLAVRARTKQGQDALSGLANQYDAEARRLHPGSERR